VVPLPHRRNLLTVCLAAVLSTVLAGALVAGTPAGAQTTPAGCAGDVVTATINSPSLPGGGWSVTDACVDARDFFTARYQDQVPFAIGISTVTYDDGHLGRLALLSIQLTADHSVTVIGMEDPATATLRFAGSVEPASVSSAGAVVAGQGISFPPFEIATLRLDLRDVDAPWPDWASTTTTSVPGATTSLPALPGVSTPVLPADTATTVPVPTVPTPTVPAPTVAPVPTTTPAGP